MTTKELVKKARIVSAKAYATYSHFKVGAALKTATGKVYTGCNIENASFGLTICAERVAIYKAISEGEKKFLTLAIWTNTKDYNYPCGACLQVINEFAPGLKIIIANRYGKYKTFKANNLLPHVFNFGKKRKL